VVGGYDGEQRSDLWCLDGESWERKADAPVAFHNRPVVSWRDVLYVLGLSGAPIQNGVRASETTGGSGTMLAWDATTDTWSWVSLGGGPESWPVDRAAAAWAQHHDKVWMIGGYVLGASPAGDPGWTLETWQLDLDTLEWSRQPDMPELRAAPEAAFCERTGQVIVFGGEDAAGNARNDTFAFTPDDDRPRGRVRRSLRSGGTP
jgi:N-acetylneuraminic acid mutarotase